MLPVILFTVAHFADDVKEDVSKPLKIFITLWLSSILLWVATPTTKEAAFIWLAPQIVENGAVKDTVKNIPELTKLGTEYLKGVLKEKIDEQQK